MIKQKEQASNHSQRPSQQGAGESICPADTLKDNIANPFDDILRLMSCIFFGIGGSSVLIRKLKPNLNIASPFNFLMASVVTGVISLVLFVVWDYIAFGLAEKLMNKNVK